jgi:hypothetical protein
MPDTTAPAPVNAMPTYADQLIGVLLGAAGQSLIASHVLTDRQLSDAVGDIVSLIGVAYAAFSANPHKQAPIAWLMSLLGKAPKSDQQQWNAAIQQAKQELAPAIVALVNTEIKRHAGILAGPIDAIADTAVKQAADTAAQAVTYTPMKV